VVEPDTSVLSRRRVAAFAVVGAAVGTWFVVASHVGAVTLWPAIIVVACGVLPGTLLLVFIALPLWSHPWQVEVGVAAALGLVALLCSVEGWALAANFAKLWAAVFAGWAFLQLFADLAWVVIVAVVVAVVDAISVYTSAGPTHQIVAHHIQIYNDVAVAFLAPHAGAAQLGPPDILFYALFLAAAARWHLRPGWTWIATTGMYSLTIVIANAANLNGVPALPFLSFGFLLANADLLWTRLRRPA
jgi:hypothetical protein